jgi:hypothetical protein
MGGKHPWCGTAWKSFAKLRMSNPRLRMFTVDIDWGYGFIMPGEQELFPAASLDYAFLEANREVLLGLVSEQDFLRTLYLQGKI